MDSFSLSLEENQSFYLKKPFLNKIYNYYSNNGYYNIISKQLVYILSNTFILIYSLFLIKCINWNYLITMEEKTDFSEIITWSNLFQLNFYNWILVLIFIFYIICKIISLIYDIVRYKYIKGFYNKTLTIKDSEIATLKWENIIEKFKEIYNNEDIDVFYINNKITAKDNYLITLFNKDIIKIRYLTQLMEWNIMYCFINPIFDKDFKYNSDFLITDKQFIKNVKDKTRVVAYMNFIFMPLLLPFMIFKILFSYGEKFYNKPELIFSRHWTLKAKWIFRNYNELYHEFHDKLLESMKPANEYSNQITIRIIETFSNLLVLILSSFFIVLVLISLINDKVLLNLYISTNKNVLWYLGILATFIAIFKNIIKEKIILYPDKKLKEIKDIINSIDNKRIKDKNDDQFFFKMYQYHIITIFKDIIYTLYVPFELFKLSYDVENIVTYMSDITINNAKYGHSNKFSLFLRENDFKTELSKETFAKNNINYFTGFRIS